MFFPAPFFAEEERFRSCFTRFLSRDIDRFLDSERFLELERSRESERCLGLVRFRFLEDACLRFREREDSFVSFFTISSFDSLRRSENERFLFFLPLFVVMFFRLFCEDS